MTVIDLPWLKPPITKNDTRRHGHHFAMKAKWDQTLSEARWTIRAAGVAPIAGPVAVVLHWQQPDRRRRDGDGAALTLSACLDALVDEGVITDDSWRYVIHSGITCHAPTPGKPGRMWLELVAPDEWRAA